MRVISGNLRGMKLLNIEGESTRPTLDRVKEAVFSMIMPYLYDADCLDLFAGSGALGIECLSRGANSALFVDINPECIKIISKNIEKAGLTARCRTINADFNIYLKSSSEKFDIIFLDPPYAMGKMSEILSSIKSRNILKDGGIIVVESDNGTVFDYAGYNLLKHKKYGRVNVFVLEGVKND